MAVHKGKEGVVEVGSAAVLEVQDWTYDDSVELLECSSLGDENKEYTPGQGDGGGTINVLYDPADATGQETMKAGQQITLTLYPIGDTAGSPQFAGTAWVESVGIAEEKAGLVTKAVTYKGRLTETDVSGT